MSTIEFLSLFMKLEMSLEDMLGGILDGHWILQHFLSHNIFCIHEICFL